MYSYVLTLLSSIAVNFGLTQIVFLSVSCARSNLYLLVLLLVLLVILMVNIILVFMDYILNLTEKELNRLISLTCDQIGRHYYWSTKGDAYNFSYHMNVITELESLRVKLKGVIT